MLLVLYRKAIDCSLIGRFFMLFTAVFLTQLRIAMVAIHWVFGCFFMGVNFLCCEIAFFTAVHTTECGVGGQTAQTTG